MDHRYGRHGAQAWLKWRKRHFNETRNLSVSEPPPIIVIYIQAPISTERVIFIVTTQENLDKEKISRELQNIGGGISQPPYIISNQPPEESEEPENLLPDILYAQAALAAQTKAIEDIDRDPEKLPTKEALRLAANKSALTIVAQYIRDNENASRYYPQLVNGFIKVFLDEYDKDLTQKRRDGTLLDARTAQIYQTVYSDKNDHYTRGNLLVDERLHHFAVVRAMKDLGLDTSMSVDAVDDIDDYVQSTTSAITRIRLIQRRWASFTGPAPFNTSMENPWEIAVVDANPNQPQTLKPLRKRYLIAGTITVGIVLVWLGILTVLFLR